MFGHSKWNNIKRKKGKVDAQRGKLFTKIIRVITVLLFKRRVFYIEFSRKSKKGHQPYKN